MTSHYRHRRDNNAAAPFANPMEKGEIAVNTANRQLAVGDAGTGQPVALLAVRYFDVRSQYALNDFVVYQDNLYVALGSVPPGAFNASQWLLKSQEPTDISNLSNYLLLAGGTMTGPLVLAADPLNPLEAATKIYVDNSTPPPPTATDIATTPIGNVAATNVQSAIAELDSEKVAKAGDTMTGHLTLPASPSAPNAVRKDYVDAADLVATNAITGLQNSKVNRGGDTMVGNLNVNADLYVSRGPTSGVVFLGSNGSHYLYFDGATYILPSGGLSLGGNLSAVGGTFGGTLNANAGSNFAYGPQHTFHSNGATFASGAPSNLFINGDNAYPTLAFHAAGYFGANFGMNLDGNFYMGGWSHGEGVAYKFWTTRDFAASSMVVGGRLVYAGAWNQGPFYGGANNRPVHSVLYDITLLSQGDYSIAVSACYVQLATQDGGAITLLQAF